MAHCRHCGAFVDSSVGTTGRGGKTGTYYISVSRGLFKGKYLHHLIYEWFHGPIKSGYDIHHKDGDPTNFHPDNLEMIRAKRHRRMSAEGQQRHTNSRHAECNAENVPF